MRRGVSVCLLSTALLAACGSDRSTRAFDAGGALDGAPPPPVDGSRDASVPTDAPITSGDGGRCGDGALTGTEQCDDYNTTSGDGCDATCAVEPGWSCVGAPSMCAPASCTDGLMNGGETGPDCGHVCVDRCSDGEGCAVADDCRSGVCATTSTCAAPTCMDGVINGLERDVDCGGGVCDPCADGLRCLTASDCASGVCSPMARCASPTCTDGVMNQGEIDVDCAGPCPLCRPFQRCRSGADCVSGLCEGSAGSFVCVVYPHLDSAEPPVGHSRELVRLHGTGFLLGPDPTVSFGGLTTTGRAVSETVIEASAPPRSAGVVDIVVTNWDGRSSNPLSWRYIEPVTFAAPVEVATPGYHPDRMASGDIDGDLDVDLVVADSTTIPDVASPVVRVLLNSSSALAPGATVTFSTSVADIALARLDADPAPDLVAGLSDGSISIARGNGDGSFAAPSRITIGDRSSSIVVTDIDADGPSDIAIAYSTLGIGYAGFLRGRGDGTFDPVASIRLPSIGIGIDAVVVGSNPVAEMFVSTPSDVRRVQYSPLLPGWMDVPTVRLVDRAAGVLAHADFEADGDFDVLTASQVWRNPGGYFTFGPSYPGATGSARDIALADFDRDGLVDVAWVSLWESMVHVGIEVYAGGLAAPAWTSPFLSRPTQAVETVDLDRDARTDIVVGARDGLYVFRNTTP